MAARAPKTPSRSSPTRSTRSARGARRPSARRDRGRRPLRAALHRARRERRRCAPRCRAASRCRGAPAPRVPVASPSTRDSPMPGTCFRSRRKARRDADGAVPIGPFGQQHLDEAERHEQALAVEELEVDRREARIAVEPGEARLDAAARRVGQRREQPDLGDPVRDRRPRRAGSRATSARARRAGSRASPRRAAPGAAAPRGTLPAPASSTAEAPRGPGAARGGTGRPGRGRACPRRRDRRPARSRLGEGRQGGRRGRVGGEEHAGARDRLEAREPGISRLAPGEQRRCMHVAAAGDLGAQPHRPAREGQPAQHLHVAQRDDRAPACAAPPRARGDRPSTSSAAPAPSRSGGGRRATCRPQDRATLVVVGRARPARRRRRSACRGSRTA